MWMVIPRHLVPADADLLFDLVWLVSRVSDTSNRPKTPTSEETICVSYVLLTKGSIVGLVHAVRIFWNNVGRPRASLVSKRVRVSHPV